MAVTAQQLTQLYLAYFGRPPDFDGMVYYTTQSNLTLQQVAANFSASPESQALYGASSLSGVIDSIYMNLFNRHAEPGGLLYWSQQIASGAISPAFAAYAILIGAQNADAAAVANKMQVATDWLAHLDTSAEITGYAGNDAAASARAFLATVDSTTASLTNAEANLDNAIAAAVSASQPGPLDVAISSPSIVEGNSGTKELAFVVTLSHASAQTITVSYTTGGGTATAGDDYQATAGSITFNPGQTTAVVNVTVFGDGTVEADETVGLTVTGTQIGNSGVSALGTITNDDSTPLLTTGLDTIDVSTTAGPNTIKGIADPGTPGASTFSNGDTIHGNGLTTVQVIAASGGNAGLVTIDNVAEVDVIAGTASTITFNAVEWTNVGAIALAGGVSGALLQVKSLADGVDLDIGANVGGSISASYTGGMFASIWNSGKGGASYEASAGDVTVHLNTDGASAGAFFTAAADLTVGDVVIDGGADSATAFFGASAGADLTVGDVTLTIGNSGSDDVFLFATGDLSAGAIAEAAGDSASAFLTVSGSGDISIASVGQNVGDSGVDVASVVSLGGGDIVLGGIAQVAGASGFASISVDGSGEITLGDLSQQVGTGTSATAVIGVHESGSGDITIGSITQGAGNFVSASITTTGSGDITVGDVVQGASSSDAQLTVHTTVGSITVGNVDQTVGDSSTASVSLSVTAAATGVTSVADIAVGVVTQTGGDGARAVFDLYGATGTTTSAAAIGGDVSVGGVAQTVGDSGSMSVSITAQDGGTVTVGDISQTGGDSATASVFVSDTSDVTIGNVTMSLGNATTTHTARFDAHASGDMVVGNVDVSVGDGVGQNAWVTLSNDNGHDLTVGDVTVGVGDLTAGTAASAESAYFGAFNFSATGDLSVGNVTMNVGLTGTGAITVSQTNATSADGGNVTVGDVTVNLADKAVLDNLYIHNSANVFTSASHTTLNSLGDTTVGDINVAMGTNAAASVTISAELSGTGGDVGVVHVGDVNFTADVNAYAYFDVFAANYAGGDMAGVEIGDVSFVMDDGGSFTLNVTVSDTSGSLDHFAMGNVSVDLGVSGDIDEFSVDVRAGSIGDASVGDISVTLGEHATGASIDLTVSATTGDIGSVSIGDINLTIGQSASLDSDVNVNVIAAGDIGSVDIGTVVHMAADSGGASDTTTAFLYVSAGGDIGSVHIGGLDMDLGASASGDGLYLTVIAGGDVGAVTVDGINAHIGSNSYVSDLFQLEVTAANVDSVTVGNETVTIDASGSRTSYDNVSVSATGDIGSVNLGDIVYHLGTAAVTNSGINRTFIAGGDIGDVTVGDIGMFAATSAAFTSGFHMNVKATAGTIGDVTVGDVTVQGTSASDSMTAEFNVTALSGIGAVTFGDLNASMVGGNAHYAWITADVNAGTGDMGPVTVGDVTAMGATSGSGYVTLNFSAANIGDVKLGDLAATGAGDRGYIGVHLTAASSIGDVTVGDVSVHLTGVSGTNAGTATVSIDINAATASGDLTVGNVDLALVLSGATPTAATAGFAEFLLTADAVTGDVSVGMISFDGTAAVTLSADLEVTGAASVHLGGVAVDNTGSFNAGDYILTVNAGGADVTIDTIKVSGAGSSDLTSILAGVSTTGTLSVGTVDYSGYTAGGAAIDLNAANVGGDVHVIGSAAGDVITSNLGSDTLTGGNGTDAFVITTQNQDLTTLTGFHAANVETITDFKAGPTSGETIAVDAEHTDVAHYSEKAASSADAAFTLALQTMTDPTQQSDVVAVQVGGDVYVFVDQDGGNDVDMIVKLTGVSNSALNFADFVVS